MGRVLLLMALCVGLAACGNANWTSVYREFSVDGSDQMTSILVDAKQRAIISKRRPPDAMSSDTAASDDPPNQPKGTGTEVVCAEPSPDTFSAVSQSFAGSGGFNAASKEVQLALSLALAESAGELRRARTIQLLRDGLFVACEGHMNGALTGGDYRKLINKYADATVTLLAIEQITPQDVTPPITLNAPATSAEAAASISNQGGQPNGGGQPQGGKQQNGQQGGAQQQDGQQGAQQQDGTQQDGQQGAQQNAQQAQQGAKQQNAQQNAQQGGKQQNAQQGAQQPGNQQQGGPSAKASTGPGSANNPSTPAAPGAPTDASVQAVQYLVKSFLTDTLLNECIEAFVGETDNHQLDANLKTFCSTIFQAALEETQGTAQATQQQGSGKPTAQQGAGSGKGTTQAPAANQAAPLTLRRKGFLPQPFSVPP